MHFCCFLDFLKSVLFEFVWGLVFERKLKQFPRTLPPLSRKSRKPVLANKYYVKRFNAQISTTY